MLSLFKKSNFFTVVILYFIDNKSNDILISYRQGRHENKNRTRTVQLIGPTNSYGYAYHYYLLINSDCLKLIQNYGELTIEPTYTKQQKSEVQ